MNTDINTVVHPEGKIKLLDGSLIDGYPMEENTPIAGDTDEERQLFLNNAFFLLSRAKQILSDSRMFLAPIDFKSGLMYSGYFARPTLGVYIEWWQSCSYAVKNDGEDIRLVYRLAGSPLSGMNKCGCVDMYCKTHAVSLDDFFRAWKPFVDILARYKESKKKYQHYTLRQVINILRNGDSSPTEDELFVEQMRNRVLQTKTRILQNRLTSLEEDYRETKRKYHYALIRLNLTEMMDFYKEYKWRRKTTEEELNVLSTKKGVYKIQVEHGQISGREAQQLFSETKRQRKELRDGLNDFVSESLRRIIPEEEIPMPTVLDFFWDYKQQQETNK